jgi:hypothetical protein
LVLSLAVVSLTGCQYDHWADGFLTTQPAERDVVGSYAVDQASLQRTIKLAISGSVLRVDPSAHISLSQDHGAEFFQVPEAIDDRVQCSVTGHGTWRLGKNDRYIVILVQLTDEESSSRCNRTFSKFGDQLNLYGDKPPYRHVTTVILIQATQYSLSAGIES